MRVSMMSLLLLLIFALALPLQAAQRQVVLVEHFTNTGCDPCAQYNPGIHAMLNTMTRDTAIKISYHVWWPSNSDPFYVYNPSDASGRVNYYGVNSVPALFVDFVLQPPPASPATMRNNIRTRFATASPCTIAVAAAPAGNTAFHFAASVTAESDMLATTNRLYVVLINDLITYSTPPGSNGETSFPDPFRDIYPHPSSGQGFTLHAGETFYYEGNLNRNVAWPLDNCTVIAFVQNATTREILQAQWAEVIVSPGTVTLTAPNGGETWYSGQTQNITWTTTNLTEDIRIQVNRDYPAGDWETIVAATPNDGLFAWPVSGPGTTAARIRVTGAVQTTAGDTSNANFSIGGVTVTAPNGGETLLLEVPTTLTWNTAALPENVRIELDRNYPSGLWTTLTTSTANDGSFDWTPTAPLTASARIRIFGTTHPTTGDTSDGDFAISARTITVITPNGGESWMAGQTQTIAWASTHVTGDVRILLNRNYPGGAWTELAVTANDGAFAWTVTSPAAANARVRVVSVDAPTILDNSDANFTITVPNLAPVLLHDPLDDFTPGTGVVTALAWDPSYLLSIASVKMFYRLQGGAAFDSLSLAPTVNPNEYSTSLAALTQGSYEYYVRAVDDGGLASYAPEGAPAARYAFDVDDLCFQALFFDDSTAESYNWTPNTDGPNFLWAVRFSAGPETPEGYAVCGAQIAVSRSLPDSAHSPIYVAVYLANGPAGLPGALLHETVTGSIGNDPGGPTPGTQWAQVIFRTGTGEPVRFAGGDFYIAVGNTIAGKHEAFGRDTSGPNAHRSYFYDHCTEQWLSEDAVSPNAYPGNRMIRAQLMDIGGPRLTVARQNDTDVILRWSPIGAPYYRVYMSLTPADYEDPVAWTLVGTTTAESMVHAGALASGVRRYYYVVGVTEP